MSNKKNVRTKNTPSIKKKVKISEEPAKYKDLKVAWQIGMIDFEGDWGYGAVSDKIRLKFTNELLEQLGDDISEDLGNALCNLGEKTYRSTDSFLDKLNKAVKTEITKEQLRIVLSHVERYYFETKIFPKLKNFENKNWHDLERETRPGKGKNKSKHHSIIISSLSKEAQKRLRQLNLNDIDELFSLRLENKLRIFGIRKFNFLQILWIDEEHKICPVSY